MKNLLIWLAVLVVLIAVIYALASNKQTEPESIPVEVTIINTSDDQPLAPGVYVIHQGSFSLNYDGQQSPASFESMAEVGSANALKEFIEGQAGVLAVYVNEAPIGPGGSERIEMMAPPKQGIYLSGVQMAVGSNDGYALIDRVQLFDESGSALEGEHQADNYDNGTEENSDLGSGFDGGQPDPSRGEENLDNGTATEPQANVTRHPQLTQTIMEVSIDTN